MDDNDLEDQKSLRNFLSKKQTKDLILALAMMMIVCGARALCYIDNGVLGTLLGSIIGYAMAGMRKIHD